jgi:hypothetical protein
MNNIDFKEWLTYEEGILGIAYNFVKDKLGNFLNYIKSFVLKSKRVQKGSVSFTFPKQQFKLSEAMYIKRDGYYLKDLKKMTTEKLQFLLGKMSDPRAVKIISDQNQQLSPDEAMKSIQAEIELKNAPLAPLEQFNSQKAGYLFEIECYLAIKNKGYEGVEERLPENYEKLKLLLQNFYEEIKKQAEQLADSIISESKRVMPCIDAVIFSGGAGSPGRGNTRKDPADLSMICKDQYFGFSVKHYRHQQSSITLAGLSKHPLESRKQIFNKRDFADFLNRMISEGSNTRLALGGSESGMLHDLLSNDFDMDPATAQYFPKHEGKVEINHKYRGEYGPGDLYRFGNVGISIQIGFKKLKEDPNDPYTPKWEKSRFTVVLHRMQPA